MGVAYPRLYRKKTGIYFVRVLFGTVQKYSELRRSLRTKDACHARRLTAALSLFIKGVPVALRQSAFNDFHSTISTWTVGGGGVSVSDDDDQNRFGRFLAELDRHPVPGVNYPELRVASRRNVTRGVVVVLSRVLRFCP